MKPNPVPAENCTDAEATTYLETHIENLTAKVEEIQDLYDDAKEESALRAWAMDRSIRVFDRQKIPTYKELTDLADSIYEYTKVQNPNAKTAQ